MTRNDTNTELLIRLIQRVPMLAIDVKAAEAEGDLPATAYQRAVTECQREATAPVAKIREVAHPETVVSLLTPTRGPLQPPT
ncbi:MULTISPECIES: hypothetical protein [unclassified Methylobacterium]|uniref:hypothetical protein n=1 Tax=unclassified Methylobacterium TaxID=2615210 RepID=UPI0011C202FA|nr:MULTISPECIES: hypothetical protein [unclassified Methylobacterium]QEE40663.1 hypothetical protein FVA80_18375 [Methylobacterium sp. WL1]TXN58013.1 hypothetical protein FV241_08535 [Methylobacterium sp. WL2]